MTNRRAHVLIEGRVQGVFFRSDLRQVADRSGVVGWVRNRADGRVEAVIEGEEADVARVVEWCRKGPPSAVVTGVEVNWEEPTGEFDRFSMTY